MPWDPVTTSDVLSEFNASEQGLLEDVQASTGDLASILARTVKAARGCVLAGGGRVSPTATEIADQLANDVIAIVRWRWLISIPKSEQLQTPERKEMYEAAMKRMDAIAAGDVKVELPTTAADVQTPDNAVQVAGVNARKSTSDKLEGL